MRVEALTDQVVALAKNKRRHIVAIAGPPGSGKSTLSTALHAELQARNEASKVIQMDGFHFDNSVLSKKGLLSRKGSPQTFDVTGFINLMGRLVAGEDNVAIPVFDRDKDISVAGADVVMNTDRILIVEGNYLLIDDTPWSDLVRLWNQSIFIAPKVCDLEKRLANRWLDQGLNAERARERALSNDLPNAHFVLRHSTAADIQIE